MAAGPKVIYEFGPFRVDPDKQVLLRDDQLVPVTPKTFDTLLMLLRHSREDVTKDELMKELWPDSFVEESNLSQNIFMLRKALGDTPEDRRYIVTLPGKGYRFVAEVRTVTQDGDDVVITSRSRAQMVAEHSAVSPEPALPALPAGQTRKFTWKHAVAASASLMALALVTVLFLQRHRPPVLSEKDSIVLADFTNTTGDSVFDGTLRQGLSIQLEQSPFLSLISDDQIRHTLQMMGQKADAQLTPDVAREICQRVGSTAVLEGSIAQIGTPYLLTVRAVNCSDGKTLASSEAEASDKNHVIDALGKMATEIRNKLGESVSTVQRFNMPLADATTSSLDALKAFTLGTQYHGNEGDDAAILFLKRAIELDPNFALAYAWLQLAYTDIGEPGEAAQYAQKAFDLRDRTSEPEKYFIMSRYYKAVTGNLEKAEQVCLLWKRAYPRSAMPHLHLAGSIYPNTGQFEKGVEEGQEALRLRPDFPPAYGLTMYDLIALDRLDDAKATYEQAVKRNLTYPRLPLVMYQLAFLQNDAAGMEQQAESADAELKDTLLANQADTAAFHGRLREAQEYSMRAADFAARSGRKEMAETILAVAALREALFGNADEAHKLAATVEHSQDWDVQYGAALALAYAGYDKQALTLADNMGQKHPEATNVQFNYLPTLHAKIALLHGNSAAALEDLTVASPYELGFSTYSTWSWTAMYPVYVRGEAYLAAHQAGEAATEFQKILNHRGLVWNSPIGALARLQLARAYAMQGDAPKARQDYQDLLNLWHDADSTMPAFVAVKRELAKMK
ncbi:MAG TPA: winged helix-turn-helix domain-containing protein [Terriglobales bacterium]|nr:winged helix-turn-helix domain-containing protein [Terriglobales bacterium]